MLSKTFFLALIISVLSLGQGKPCPRGTVVAPTGCKPCLPGTYSEDLNSKACRKCPPGTFHGFPKSPSRFQCLQCPYNTFSKAGAAKCVKCPRGKFSRKAYSRCFRKCAAGSALSATREGCTKCRRGFFRPREAPSTNCLQCPSGTTSGPGSSRCRKCPIGRFRDTQFSKEGGPCRKCPRNTFADERGTVQCKLCPLGTFANRGAKVCTSCPAGTFRGIITQQRCLPCPKGSTSLGKKPAGCKHPKRGCAINTFKDKNGECRSCMPGERLNVKKKKCVKCGKRQVSVGGLSKKCITCPRGQRPANSNSIFEKSRCECKPGTTSDGAGGCVKCPAGTRSTQEPSSFDLRLPFVRSTNYVGPRCEECEIGSIADKPGRAECKLCPLGTFASDRGNTECTPCLDGFISPAGDPTDIDDMLDTDRGKCLSLRTGCESLQDDNRRDEDGQCKFAVETEAGCPPNTVFILPTCGRCPLDNFYDPSGFECVACPDESASRGGISDTCEECPRGAFGQLGRCACSGQFENDGKGGCRPCPRGEVSGSGKCAPCPVGSYRSDFEEFFAECSKCDGDSVLLPGEEKCTKCRPGFKKELDVLGEEVNNCIPKDGFPVSE